MRKTNKRIGDWLQTYTGKKFYPLDPDPDDIDIVDIAHALGQLCRYAGHTRGGFYSVAEHSLLISQALPPNLALAGLLHDAAEAYLVDVPRPVKAYIPDYKQIERMVECVIALKFGLDWPMPELIKEYDTRILLNEQEQAMKLRRPYTWGLKCDPLPGVVIRFLEPTQAKTEFLQRFAALRTIDWKKD